MLMEDAPERLRQAGDSANEAIKVQRMKVTNAKRRANEEGLQEAQYLIELMKSYKSRCETMRKVLQHEMIQGKGIDISEDVEQPLDERNNHLFEALKGNCDRILVNRGEIIAGNTSDLVKKELRDNREIVDFILHILRQRKELKKRDYEKLLAHFVTNDVHFVRSS